MHSYDLAADTVTTSQTAHAHKERRVAEQRRILSLGGHALIHFTMNIPDTCENFPLASAGFHEGILQIWRALSDVPILYQSHAEDSADCDAYFLLDADPIKIKQECIQLEKTHPLGKLWNIDVLASDGSPLSRNSIGIPPRPCWLCGKDSDLCAREHAHDSQTCREKAAALLKQYFRDEAADSIRRCAERALWAEACTTPKPGLVDLRNSGSHSDMALYAFMDSIHALSPHFSSFYSLGWSCSSEKLLYEKLRVARSNTERAMQCAVNGIRPRNGIIFSFAILCGALGMLQASCRSPQSLASLRKLCQQIGANDLAQHGEHPLSTDRLGTSQDFDMHSEIVQGFPSAFEYGLPALRSWLKKGANLNQAAVAALLCLIAHIEDNGIIRYAGRNVAAQRRKEAAAVYACSTLESIVAMVQRLDESYIINRLSPDHAADLLSVSLLLHFLVSEGILVE